MRLRVALAIVKVPLTGSLLVPYIFFLRAACYWFLICYLRVQKCGLCFLWLCMSRCLETCPRLVWLDDSHKPAKTKSFRTVNIFNGMSDCGFVARNLFQNCWSSGGNVFSSSDLGSFSFSCSKESLATPQHVQSQHPRCSPLGVHHALFRDNPEQAHGVRRVLHLKTE